jgi:hypothetical protein
MTLRRMSPDLLRRNHPHPPYPRARLQIFLPSTLSATLVLLSTASQKISAGTILLWFAEFIPTAHHAKGPFTPFGVHVRENVMLLLSACHPRTTSGTPPKEMRPDDAEATPTIAANTARDFILDIRIMTHTVTHVEIGMKKRVRKYGETRRRGGGVRKEG